LSVKRLGIAYQNGQGVEPDFTEAAKWLRKAADQGDAYAQVNVGWLYANGQGVAQDDTQALMWSTLAVAGAEDDATRELAVKVRDTLLG
jgi:TPR repeat protein